jgi:hypothetical protein
LVAFILLSGPESVAAERTHTGSSSAGVTIRYQSRYCHGYCTFTWQWFVRLYSYFGNHMDDR